MCYSTCIRLIFCAFFCAFYCLPSFGHDLGITKATLEQTSAQNYALRVSTSSTLAYQITAPELPSQCMLLKPFRGQLVDSVQTFNFRCDDGLTTVDTLDLRWQRDGVFMTAVWLGKGAVKSLFLRNGDIISIPLGELSAASASLQVKAKRYLELGISHILTGFDHLFFVFGIILIVRSPALLIKTITAFTVAHSLTLALAFLQMVRLPIEPVEACIALSIVVLAYEIIKINKGEDSLTGRYPWIVAGGFGLLHGLGFSGALSSLGVPASDVPLALLFFNVGVELGQLLFIALIVFFAYSAKYLIGYCGYTFVHKSQWSNPLAYGLGFVSMYWAIERSVLIFT